MDYLYASIIPSKLLLLLLLAIDVYLKECQCCPPTWSASIRPESIHTKLYQNLTAYSDQ